MILAENFEKARDADLVATADRLGLRLRRGKANERIGRCPACGGEDKLSIGIKRENVALRPLQQGRRSNRSRRHRPQSLFPRSRRVPLRGSATVTEPARTKQSESNLDWALNYASHGMSVFPISAAKDPLVRWRKGDATQRATTDPATIEAWWAKWPYADCGWALPETLLVVDVDRKDGRYGFSDFTRLFGSDPRDVETPITTSPSGGLHLFYRAAKAYKNAVAIDGMGLDTRSEGGIVPAPIAQQRPRVALLPLSAPSFCLRLIGSTAF